MTWIVDASYTISIITFVYFETTNNILGNRSKWLTTIVINGARCHSSSITRERKKEQLKRSEQNRTEQNKRKEERKKYNERKKRIHVDIFVCSIRELKRKKGTFLLTSMEKWLHFFRLFHIFINDWIVDQMCRAYCGYFCNNRPATTTTAEREKRDTATRDKKSRRTLIK